MVQCQNRVWDRGLVSDWGQREYRSSQDRIKKSESISKKGVIVAEGGQTKDFLFPFLLTLSVTGNTFYKVLIN